MIYTTKRKQGKKYIVSDKIDYIFASKPVGKFGHYIPVTKAHSVRNVQSIPEKGNFVVIRSNVKF